MTGPTPLAELVEDRARRLLNSTTDPDRALSALQVLATLELADAVRSTRVELEPVTAELVNTDRANRPFCEAEHNGLVCNERFNHIGSHWGTSSEGRFETWSR